MNANEQEPDDVAVDHVFHAELAVSFPCTLSSVGYATQKGVAEHRSVG